MGRSSLPRAGVGVCRLSTARTGNSVSGVYSKFGIHDWLHIHRPLQLAQGPRWNVDSGSWLQASERLYRNCRLKSPVFKDCLNIPTKEGLFRAKPTLSAEIKLSRASRPSIAPI
jgi:hypothetical protein